MSDIFLYNEKTGSLSKHKDVLDVVKLNDSVRIKKESGEELNKAGVIFKGAGIFRTYVDPFHGDEIESYENIVDPVIMPGGIVTLLRSDGVKATLRGEILRMKVIKDESN